MNCCVAIPEGAIHFAGFDALIASLIYNIRSMTSQWDLIVCIHPGCYKHFGPTGLEDISGKGGTYCPNFERGIFMPNSKRIILMIQFSLLFAIGGYCSEQAEDTAIIPVGWWDVSQSFDREHAMIYSFNGDYGFTRYWEINCCGAPTPEYKILRTPDSLAAYWKNLNGKCSSLEMPQVDFKKNILLIMKPGQGNLRFKYKVSSTMKNCDVNFVVTQFLAGSLVQATLGAYPLLAFELPKPGSGQKINVKINLDRRANGPFPK